MPQKLDSLQIKQQLALVHQDWSSNTDFTHIQRLFEFENYYQTIAFVNSVAWIAHQHDHHPDLQVSYRTCQVNYSTHSAGGISALDFTCAGAIDNLLNA